MPEAAVDLPAERSLHRAGEATSPRRRIPPRVSARPRSEEWTDDELLTLPEAAALFWPDGPITTNTLRTAGHQGTLAITRVAGKFFTTPMAVRRMGAEHPVPVARTPEAVPDVSAQALFQVKLAEAKRLGRERARPKRAAERPAAPAPKGRAGQ
ncbi:hypothetical protein [Methylorubrum thiocyanatum]|uniref:Uncharacterized protein n=1 Tax=Methylorubrum thiocyanatum TaxID=47958 RepID=A0AA40S5D9_9HYPH|nr:hypothetical protein [Methylorubrum thiocyanatum]MBA8914719.1 hypothetical protein [Methylorubrum thiocyanatum]